MVLRRLRKLAATAAFAVAAASAGNFGAMAPGASIAPFAGYTIHTAPASKVEVIRPKPGQSFSAFIKSIKGRYRWLVNANYFHPRTRKIIGFAKDDGERLKSLSPKVSRTAVGIFKDGKGTRIMIGRMLHTASGKLYAHGNINWLDAFEAVQGGPKLVEDGKIVAGLPGRNEGFDNNFLSRRTKRTVVGMDRAGNLKTLVFHADVSLKRAAQVAKNNGLLQAVNFDGSDSVVLYDGTLQLHTKGRYPPIYLAARK